MPRRDGHSGQWRASRSKRKTSYLNGSKKRLRRARLRRRNPKWDDE